MATINRTISVTEHTDWPGLLDDAAKEPIIIEHGGERFRLSRADDTGTTYDPARVREGLRRFAGTINPVAGERRKALIFRGREEGTRPLDRP